MVGEGRIVMSNETRAGGRVMNYDLNGWTMGYGLWVHGIRNTKSDSINDTTMDFGNNETTDMLVYMCVCAHG